MPSWQARFFSTFIAGLVRRRHWGEPRRLARRARRVFGSPQWYTWIRSANTRIDPIAAPIRGEWITPTAACPDPEPERERGAKGRKPRGVILYLHGGGYVSCSVRTHRPATAALVRRTGCRVFAVEYRLAPEHPFPAALEDAEAAYRWLVSTGVDPSSIAIAGDSAGGGLTLALLMRLRDSEPRTLPACAVVFSPWTDLAGAGPSGVENDGRCAMFRPENLSEFAAAYLAGVSPLDPRASPVYGDFSGLPPVLLHVSSTELLLDDAHRVHDGIQRSGGTSVLRVFDDVSHGWQLLDGLVPEAGESLDDAAAFVCKHL